MLRRLVLSLFVAVNTATLLGAYSIFPIISARAEDDPTATTAIVDSAPTEVTPPVDPAPIVVQPSPDPTPTPIVVSPGPQTPPGPAANTYVYNEQTGLWENDHYTWNPITKQTQPKDTTDYSYNPTTGMWDTTQWAYNPATKTYQENAISIPPQIAAQQQLLEEAATNLPSLQGDLLRALGLITTTGPQSSNNISTNSSNSGFFDLFHNAKISNTLVSNANTGDATVMNNTSGGSATSGDAQTVANLFNVLNSSLGFLSGNPVMFMANILGNVLGDLFINPGQLPNQANTQQLTNSDLQVKAQNNGVINNDIQLSANSGAATVASNTQAGSATTGNALAMANVVNAINSAVGSGQSFMGLINIYGNFNGDILLPPGFVNSLLASNAQAPATAVSVVDPNNPIITTSSNIDTTVNVTDNSNVSNNIAVDATSGGATIAGNTNAGSAQTGNANTNVTLLNLTGKQVVGKNALLVFVNVLGHWVGMILNAPGATAGALGSGDTSQSSALNATTNIDATTNSSINNNISAHAQSGDALVANNTSAGNATSGNAAAAVNVLNITNSSFSLTDWFGILFINVLGNWYGSFGVDTDAGNAVATTTPTNSTDQAGLFAFVAPKSSGSSSTNNSPRVALVSSYNSNDSSTQVLPAIIGSSNNNKPVSTANVSVQKNVPLAWIALALLAAAIIAFGDKAYNRLIQYRVSTMP